MKKAWIIRIVLIGVVVGAIYGFLLVPNALKGLFPQKSINVLAWPAVLDGSEFERFEKETGIKVYLTYFENYEELVVKMKAGAGDYDLIMTSDYGVAMLLKENVVKPIDKKKLNFWQDLYKPLLNLYFDPDNMYTIPFAWEAYGLGVYKPAFGGETPPATWKLIFEKGKVPKGVGMLDDAREIISAAAMYLFGKNHSKNLTLDELKQIKALLMKQKEWVSMYTDLRTDYLLFSHSVSVVMGVSSDIYQAMRENDDIAFLLPEEGSFLLIDNLLIPAATKKDDMVYSFLNFLFRPDVLSVYADRYNFFPVSRAIDSKNNRYMITPTNSMFSHLSFFNYQIPEEAMRSLWIALKS